MPLYQGFSIGVRLIAMITCSALAILVFFQLRQDAKSRLFAVLMASITGVALFGTLSRFARALGYGDSAVYTMWVIGSIITGMMPPAIFMFAAEFLGAWTAWRRWVARILLTASAIAAVQFTLDRGFVDFSMSVEGYVTYTLQPFIVFLLGMAELGILLTLQIVIEQYVKKRNEVNVRLLVGFGILCFGYLLIIVPAANRHAVLANRQ